MFDEFATDSIVMVGNTKKWSQEPEANIDAMELAETVVETKTYIVCPHCKEDKTLVSHLFQEAERWKTFGTWYCDKCGGSYKGCLKNGQVYVEKLTQTYKRTCVFLKKDNMILIVKGGQHSNLENNDRYFYEEHTCPTNYLKSVEVIVDTNRENTDPHGIFEYLGTIPYQDFNEKPYEEILNLVEMAQNGALVLDVNHEE